MPQPQTKQRRITSTDHPESMFQILGVYCVSYLYLYLYVSLHLSTKRHVCIYLHIYIYNIPIFTSISTATPLKACPAPAPRWRLVEDDGLDEILIAPKRVQDALRRGGAGYGGMAGQTAFHLDTDVSKTWANVKPKPVCLTTIPCESKPKFHASAIGICS